MTNRLHTRYILTIEVLSPVHIGTGTELQVGLDCVVHGGKTWVINVDELWEQTLDEDGIFSYDLSTVGDLGQWLRSEDYTPDSPLFHYVMPGQPRGNKLREQIKDAWRQPYLPGSSVKGALRTLLAWGERTVKVNKGHPLAQAVRLDTLGNRREWAAQRIEQDIFGGDPNHSWLRALQVGDSAPVGREALQVVQTHVIGSAKGQIPINVEAIRRGTIFQVPITIDEYGFSPGVVDQLQWTGKRVILKQIAKVGQYYATQRLTEDESFFANRSDASRAAAFLNVLRTQHVRKPNEWLMQLGWGAGWRSKTLNNLIYAQPKWGQQVIQRYRIRGNAANFPATRKLALDAQGQPDMPLGWIKCRLDEAKVFETKKGGNVDEEDRRVSVP